MTGNKLISVAFVGVMVGRQVNRVKKVTQKTEEKTQGVVPGPTEKELLADVLVVLQKK